MKPPAFKSYTAAIIDFPWQFDTHSDAGKGKSADQHYPTLPTDDGIALREPLNLDFIFAPNAVAIFWGTWPMMARGDVHRLVIGWGFTPVSGGSWHKITGRRKDTFGGGYMFRDSCEPFIVATRGDPGLPAVRNVRNGFRALRRGHSVKPDYLHRALERMYPNGTYIEFFAKRPRPNWDRWGLEADGPLTDYVPPSRAITPAPLLDAMVK